MAMVRSPPLCSLCRSGRQLSAGEAVGPGSPGGVRDGGERQSVAPWPCDPEARHPHNPAGPTRGTHRGNAISKRPAYLASSLAFLGGAP